MTTENLSPENLDTNKPAPPAAPTIPPGFIDVTRIHERDLEYMDQATADQVRLAQAAAREEQRKVKAVEDAKRAKESAESTARAKAVTDEVIQRGEKDGEEEAEPQLLQPGKFELEVPDTLTPSQQKVAGEIAEDVAAIATHAAIPQEEAQTILESALDIAATILPNGEEPNLANRDECIAVMEHRWGDVATKELIADAGKAYTRLGRDVQAWLDAVNEFGEQIGNSPAAIYALAMWQRGYTRMSPEKAAAEVARLRGTREYQRGDKGFTDQVALLSKVAARGQSREMAIPRAEPRRPAPTSWTQVEIEKIRANKDYTSMDAKKRAPLVKRMGELMAQLHQG